ncbi:MAG: tRNA lysidine(34) synthetase TilS [Bacteroidetes bacterium]|nr:tRNA lysidine(34) synthetase TilS [Bacteroidota bacterium]
MDLYSAFTQHWQEKFTVHVPAQDTLLVAVSGGVDSMVLAHLLLQMGFPIQLAHMNFQLRGEESERDEQFVKDWANKNKIPLHVKKSNAAEYAEIHSVSIQEAARNLRYEWFRLLQTDLSNLQSKVWLATAHHADDNIETLLLHLFRGTGLEGLAGIQPLRKKEALIRPLLTIPKSDLLSYATANGIAFVEDSSNAHNHYTRNQVRNQLMPVIQEIFPDAPSQMLANINRFREGIQVYRKAITTHIEKITTLHGVEQHIPVEAWKKLDPIQTYTWEIIQAAGFHPAQIPAVLQLLEAATGKHCLSSTHRIIRNRKHLIIAPLANLIHTLIQVDRADKTISFSNGVINLEAITYNSIPQQTPDTEAFLQEAALEFPLLIRKWQTGDYFYPLGLNKKKKISRFLIDCKVSATEKEKVYVLESNHKIAWVIGYRIDHRFRLQKASGTALHLQYQK